MLRSVLVLFVVLSVVGCSNTEPEVKPTLTPSPRPVSSACKEILKAASTISKFGNLYRDVYTAIEKGSSLSNLPNNRYLTEYSGISPDELDNALFQLQRFDDSVMRWSDAWSSTTRAAVFFAYAPRNDRDLANYNADHRYFTLKQLRGPIGAMRYVENYVQVISREHDCS